MNFLHMTIDHIGIAVKDLDASALLFAQLTGNEPFKREKVDSQNVEVLFIPAGSTKLELIQGLDGDSAIKKFIEKRGEGLHHLAFRVTDIYAAMAEMQTKGFELIDQVPRRGADHKLICFLQPRSTGGVLIELCQPVSDPLP